LISGFPVGTNAAAKIPSSVWSDNMVAAGDDYAVPTALKFLGFRLRRTIKPSRRKSSQTAMLFRP
jgi:hypothetical protein